jgi:EAL domain-containing protein (putative c-di-GMP-specific phosphodiesterase class I)
MTAPITTLPTLDHIAWQPIVHLRSGRVLGHEALARFAGGTPAAAFAARDDPAALVALDAHCAGAALAGPPPTGLLFLNVTAATIRAGAWPRVPAGLAPRVVWELPEDAGWDVTMLPPGSAWALDDLGAGFQELLRLAAVPWRFCKLDAALTAATGVPGRLVVRELVAWAAARGGAVIAEGVETSAQARRLAAWGVTYGQGFLWGRPAPLSLRRAAPALRSDDEEAEDT